MARASGAKYRHTNLIARDWKRLAEFYERVFGCVPVPPERDLSGAWLERISGVVGAHLRGVHLRLPGGGPDGPTLEIFQYTRTVDEPPPPANRVGFTHLAFSVDDVPAALAAVLEEGGARLGEVQTRDVPGVGQLEVTYVRDPEGNILELQRWSSAEPGARR